MSQTQPLISDNRLVLFAVVGGIVAFAIALTVISGGFVRHVQIFLPEKAYATVAFRNIDGQVKLVGIEGVAGINPTILMRTGDFAMELTVLNQDNEAGHLLYIDGDMHVSTKFLNPGQSDVLTFYSKGEATYNYYDYAGQEEEHEPLGQIRAVKVTMYE